MTAATWRAGRPGRQLLLLALLAAAALVAAVLVGSVARSPGSPADPQAAALERSARAAAATFLTRYVDADGRVVRRDQGGDTVSEGQAYGMLLAVADMDEARFDAVWGWTRAHLLQPSGLMAWRWRAGSVVDPQPATDADLDASQALMRAARVFDRPELRGEGRALAGAVLAQATVPAVDGRLLVAGPWARQDPAIVNPSYLAPGTARTLGAQTGDAGWSAVARTQQSLLDTLLGTPPLRLPSDWARVPAPQGLAQVTQAVPSGAPDGSAGPVYGYDAPRLLVRLASSCAPEDRADAAGLVERLARRPLPALLDLDGSARADYEQPLGLVAAAAVEHALGDEPERNALLEQAGALPAATDTYYGSAWAALGRSLLTPSPLTPCDPGAAA